MIYDLFMYSGEDEILEIRLNELKDLPCKHIIVESEYSHSGIKKGLKFDANKFSEFSDKIEYRRVDLQHYENIHYTEMFHRETTWKAIKDRVKSDDIIINSDIDEIPKFSVLSEVVTKLDQPTTLCGDYMMFCLDLYGRPTIDAFIIKAGWKKENLAYYRSHRTNFQYKTLFKHVNNASWHYSSVGTPKNICDKLKYFCHANEFESVPKTEEYIKECIQNKRGDYKNNNTLKWFEIDYNNSPQFLVENKAKFQHLLFSRYQ